MQAHLERVRQDLLHAVGESRRRSRDVERDAEVRGPETLGALLELLEGSLDVEEFSAARERDAADLHRTTRVRFDEHDALGLGDFPEVELERRARVLGPRRRRHALRPVEVVERHVVRGRGQPLRRDRVDLPDVERPFTAAHEPAVDEDVRHQDVHRVRAEPVGESLDHLRHTVGVRLVPLLLGIEESARVHNPGLLHKGQHGDVGDLVAVTRGQRDDAAGVRRAGLGSDVDLEGIEQLAERGQTPRMVVVAADDDDRDADAAALRERCVDEALGFGPRRKAVEDITTEEQAVDGFATRDVHDLRQNGGLLVEAVPALEHLPDVPIARVEEAHQRSNSFNGCVGTSHMCLSFSRLTGAHPRTTSASLVDPTGLGPRRLVRHTGCLGP